jgi:hypothetical protein
MLTIWHIVFKALKGDASFKFGMKRKKTVIILGKAGVSVILIEFLGL